MKKHTIINRQISNAFDPENIWTFLLRNKKSYYLCTTVLHFEVESIRTSFLFVAQ